MWTNLSEDIAAEFGHYEPHESSLEANVEQIHAYNLARSRDYNEMWRWKHKTHHTRRHSGTSRAIYPPGVAHLNAVKRYQERHLALGLCFRCPQPTFGRTLCPSCSRVKSESRVRNLKLKGKFKGSMCKCGAPRPAKHKSLCSKCLLAMRHAYIAKRKPYEAAVATAQPLQYITCAN